MNQILSELSEEELAKISGGDGRTDTCRRQQEIYNNWLKKEKIYEN